MVLRPDAYTRFGGDVVQAEKTAAALRKLGVNAWVSTGGDLAKADVAHIFNLLTPEWTLRQVRAAESLRKPVVLSTVYWRNLSQLAGALLTLPGLLPPLLRAVSGRRSSNSAARPRSVALFPASHRREFRKILAASRVLAPNSQGEADRLVTDFPELRPRRDAIRVVPNGVDVDAFDRQSADHEAPLPPGLPERFALCVARIDYRKNQLRLIRATQRIGLPLVLRGDPPTESLLHDAYFEACRRRGGAVTFVGPVGEDVLWSLYRRCAVHCLPSFYETPGLSNLEAGLAGKPIVATPYGPTREYFGDLAEYCEPTRVASIAAAIERALDGPRQEGLAARIRERFTWARAAEATRAAYQQALG